jgi:hypothetical protein
MFSLRGLYYFYYDAFFINILPLYYIFLIIERINRKDWTFNTIESDYKLIDMNRLFIMQDIGPDLWDYEYWKRVEEGVDCDGRIGPGEEGFFCYCPS